MEFLNLGWSEILLIFTLAFIVLGPNRIRKFGGEFGAFLRKLGRSYKPRTNCATIRVRFLMKPCSINRYALTMQRRACSTLSKIPAAGKRTGTHRGMVRLNRLTAQSTSAFEPLSIQKRCSRQRAALTGFRGRSPHKSPIIVAW